MGIERKLKTKDTFRMPDPNIAKVRVWCPEPIFHCPSPVCIIYKGSTNDIILKVYFLYFSLVFMLYVYISGMRKMANEHLCDKMKLVRSITSLNQHNIFVALNGGFLEYIVAKNNLS